MTRAGGGLSYLAIGTIFLVVLGTMHAGIQYSEGELLDREPPTETETQLRAAIWESIDAERAERGLDPARRETSVRVAAQETAGRIATGGYLEGDTAVGFGSTAPDPVANVMGLCEQVPVKITVAGDDRNGTGDAEFHDGPSRRIADRTAQLLAEGDGDGRVEIYRADGYHHGIGVAVSGDVVYVVYRTCNLGY